MNRDFVPVDLSKGEYTLLIKVENCGGPGGFIARMVREPPKALATLSRDEEGFDKNHERLVSLLTERGYDWALTGTAKGDALVYRVYPHQYEKAHRALMEAIKLGQVQATPAHRTDP